MKKIKLASALRVALTTAVAASVAALTIAATASDSSASAAQGAHTSKSSPITAIGALIPVTPTRAGRLIQVHRATSPVRGGHATLMPHALVRRATAHAAAAKTCLAVADLKNPAYVGTAVDWAHGVADFVTRLPLCRGVGLAGAGAAYAFYLGATPHGAGHPSVPLWPQRRVSTTAWQGLSAAAGHHRFRFPAVTNPCAQFDVGLRSNGWNGAWPAVLGGPGQPQPYEIAFYVGDNHGCLSPPAIHVVAKCKGDCDGHGSVTYTCSNLNPYATIQCWLVAGTTKLPGLTVGPRKSGTITVGLNDGQQYHFVYRVGFVNWSVDKGVGGNYVLNCPPIPHLTMTIDCPCRGTLSGRYEDVNTTRYTHVLTFTTGGHVLATLTVAPHSTLSTGALSWAKGADLVATNQSKLGAVKVAPSVRLSTTRVS
jgi:hypothetical protein